MTTQTAQGPVPIKVVGKEVFKGDVLLKVWCEDLGFKEDPSGRRYPLTLYRVPEADLKQMDAGGIYLANIVRGKPKKEGATAAWDFHYDWHGFGNPQDAARAAQAPRTAPQATAAPVTQQPKASAPPAATSAAPEPTAPARLPMDTRDMSIARQVALKACNDYAIAYMTAHVGETELGMGDIAERFTYYMELLTMGQFAPKDSA